MFYLPGKWEKFGDVLVKKGNFIMINESNMVKPEKFDHLHLVYYFTVIGTFVTKIFFDRYSKKLHKIKSVNIKANVKQ